MVGRAGVGEKRWENNGGRAVVVVEEEEEEEEEPAWRCLSLEAPSSSPGTGAVTLIGS